MHVVRNLYSMVRTKTFQQCKQNYLLYLSSTKGRSEKTIENYDRYLKRFLFFTKITYSKDITESLIKEYQVYLDEQMFCSGRNGTACEPLKSKTKNYHLTALRSFIKYLRLQNETIFDPKKIKLSSVSANTREILTEIDIKRLLSAPSGNDLKTLRDRAILFFLFSSGVRVSELCSFNVDIDLTNGLSTVQGKKGKERTIYISPEAKEAVYAYLQARDDTSEALFVNNGKHVSAEGDTRLSSRSVQRIVRQYALQAGISKKITLQEFLKILCKPNLAVRSLYLCRLKVICKVQRF